MRLLLALTLGIMLTGCGDTFHVHPPTTPEDEVTNTIVEGLYYFQEENSEVIDGPIELSYNFDGTMDAYSTGSLLRSQNYNGSYGTHPKINFNRVYPISGTKLVYSNNINYSSSNDLEEDGSSSNITGSHYTTYSFDLVDGELSLTITIYDQASNASGGINGVVAVRSFKALSVE